jgi:hypothetical protein
MSPAEQWDACLSGILPPADTEQPPGSDAERPTDAPSPHQQNLPTWDNDTIDFLLYMLEPSIIRDTSSEEDGRTAYVGGRQAKLRIDSPGDNVTRQMIYNTLNEALRRFQSRLVANAAYDYRIPLPDSHSSGSMPEADFRSLIGRAIRKLRGAYKVGASLYVFHQMRLLKKSGTPSLSKSQWLVDNAPLLRAQATEHRRRGDHRKIGENWAKYFAASHYWAAFVVLTGNAFALPDDALARFLLHTDVDEFKRLAATFLHFRRSLKAAAPKHRIRDEPHIFKALDTYLTRADFEHTLPMPDIAIPSLIADFQWDELCQYSSDRQEAALRPPRKGMLPVDESGW